MCACVCVPDESLGRHKLLRCATNAGKHAIITHCFPSHTYTYANGRAGREPPFLMFAPMSSASTEYAAAGKVNLACESSINMTTTKAPAPPPTTTTKSKRKRAQPHTTDYQKSHKSVYVRHIIAYNITSEIEHTKPPPRRWLYCEYHHFPCFTFHMHSLFSSQTAILLSQK